MLSCLSCMNSRQKEENIRSCESLQLRSDSLLQKISFTDSITLAKYYYSIDSAVVKLQRILPDTLQMDSNGVAVINVYQLRLELNRLKDTILYYKIKSEELMQQLNFLRSDILNNIYHSDSVKRYINREVVNFNEINTSFFALRNSMVEFEMRLEENLKALEVVYNSYFNSNENDE